MMPLSAFSIDVCLSWQECLQQAWQKDTVLKRSEPHFESSLCVYVHLFICLFHLYQVG